jgi:hypothetical protein
MSSPGCETMGSGLAVACPRSPACDGYTLVAAPTAAAELMNWRRLIGIGAGCDVLFDRLHESTRRFVSVGAWFADPIRLRARSLLSTERRFVNANPGCLRPFRRARSPHSGRTSDASISGTRHSTITFVGTSRSTFRSVEFTEGRFWNVVRPECRSRVARSEPSRLAHI